MAVVEAVVVVVVGTVQDMDMDMDTYPYPWSQSTLVRVDCDRNCRPRTATDRATTHTGRTESVTQARYITPATLFGSVTVVVTVI